MAAVVSEPEKAGKMVKLRQDICRRVEAGGHSVVRLTSAPGTLLEQRSEVLMPAARKRLWALGCAG